MSKRIFILYTGGTIGMGHRDPEDSNSPLEVQSWESLQEYMPSIQPSGYFQREKDIVLDYHAFPSISDSSQFTTSEWLQMAEAIEEHYGQYDGFIIIHGTDTMAYSASGLSFLLNNLGKPVVFTGAQLPISHPRTDAVNNLSTAIHLAAAGVFGMEPVPEVCICFNDRLLRGNRATKLSTNDFEGFDSPNYPRLGDLEERIRIHHQRTRKYEGGHFDVQRKVNTNVLDISLFPGLKAAQLDKLISDPTIQGLVIRTYGSGNAPCTDDFVDVLKSSRSRGTHIMFVTQCIHGGVHLGKYAASKVFEEIGVISGGDMTNEAALAKMMVVLGRTEEPDLVKKYLIDDLRGERSY